MKIILIVLFCMIAFAESSTSARELPQHEVTAEADDYALRQALISGNLAEFEQLLSRDANPTEWLDDSQFGWVYCAATAKGSEKFLRLLIDKGYDVNFRQLDISSSISLPLTCAIRFENMHALEMLVAAGADPTAPPSIKFPARVPMSVMSQAIIIGKYDLAVGLFDKGNYSELQLRSDIGMLERHPVNESAPGNTYRLQLAELFRQRGYEVNLWTRDKSTEK